MAETLPPDVEVRTPIDAQAVRAMGQALTTTFKDPITNIGNCIDALEQSPRLYSRERETILNPLKETHNRFRTTLSNMSNAEQAEIVSTRLGHDFSIEPGVANELAELEEVRLTGNVAHMFAGAIEHRIRNDITPYAFVDLIARRKLSPQLTDISQRITAALREITATVDSIHGADELIIAKGKITPITYGKTEPDAMPTP
jgi:hypothetical protein